ncbi:P-loop containing nucleoside triphosphate hydrolase protein [Apiospora sp. TS-2023a]
MASEPVRQSSSPISDNPQKGTAVIMASEQIATLSDDNKAAAVLDEATMIREEREDLESLQDKLELTPPELQQFLDREREDGTLEIRSRQAVLYFTYAELRIEGLETELKKVKQDLYNLPDDAEVRRNERSHPVYRHLLQRSNPSQFRLGKASFDVPREDRAALEVLITEHIGKLQQPEESEPVRKSTSLDSDQASIQWSPEQLRIRSRPLLMHLQKITATQISDELDVPAKHSDESSIVFLRPFKFLVAFEKEIRQSIGDVEVAVQLQEQDKSFQGEKKRLPNKSQFDNKDLLEDLKLLIQFMDEDLKPTFDLRQRIKDCTADMIAYADLWHLFHRGGYVLLQSDPDHAYRALQYTGGRPLLTDRYIAGRHPPQNPNRSILDGFSVDCLSVESDGSSYVPKLTTVSILPYLGSVPIKTLAVYPMELDPEFAAKQRDFMEQGRRYIDLTTRPYAHKNFVGKTLDEPSYDLDAQVIVDLSLAIHSKPDWKPNAKITREDLTHFNPHETSIKPYCFHHANREGCCGSDVAFKDWEMDQMRLDSFKQENGRLFSGRDAKDMSDEDLMLLPTWVHAFVLRTRRWVTIRTSDLSEVEFVNDFENLMLPEENKTTIQALVKTHENARGSLVDTSASGSVGSSIDLVKGKGSGLILLLHGAPGVGKTSTAECVADNTKRPLFPVTCGDIGETATEVEDNLQHHFELAHKWGCVLLLDEADVFLAKRTRNDLRRNAVTSVFLRSLEYYAGILFLTTNRVGNIDPAFKSRIHLSLLYQPFDKASTRRLYEIFIDRTKAEQKRRGPSHFLIKRKEIITFAKENFREMKREGLGAWNGRQIRNTFQAAISLAESEYQKQLVDGQYPQDKKLPELGRSQLATVADRSKQFDRYLMTTLGMDESDLAYEEQWRADQFPTNNAGAAGAALLTTKEKRGAAAAAPPAVVGGGNHHGTRPAPTAPRRKGKGGSSSIAPEVTSSEDEESSSEDDEDDDEEEEDGGGGGKERKTEESTTVKPDESDLDDEEELEAIREMMRRKKKKGKK